jgi:predicted RecA/RadA family phage recombinase
MPYIKRDDYFEVSAGSILAVTSGTDILPDTIIVSGELVGITKFGYKAGDIVLAYLEGEYKLPIAAFASNTAQGTPLYVEETGGSITTDATTGTNDAPISNIRIGVISRDAFSGDTFVYVYLNR